MNDLMVRAEWMVKYGLPWVKANGNVTTQSLMKYLDCDEDVIYRIRRQANEQRSDRDNLHNSTTDLCGNDSLDSKIRVKKSIRPKKESEVLRGYQSWRDRQ